jgi:Double zinc ribbon
MRGPRCQAKDPDNPRFCKECGVRLALACSQCGSEISPGNPGPAHAQDAWGTSPTTATSLMTSSPRTTKPFVSLPFILGLSVNWRPRRDIAPRPAGGVL